MTSKIKGLSMNVTEIILYKFLNLPARNVTEQRIRYLYLQEYERRRLYFFVINHYFSFFLTQL